MRVLTFCTVFWKKQGRESVVKIQNDAEFLLNLVVLQCIILIFTTYLYI